jgi:hypothetical protein
MAEVDMRASGEAGAGIAAKVGGGPLDQAAR